MACSYQEYRNIARTGREDVKLGSSPGWNLVRAERSRLCINACVERKFADGSDDKQNDLHIICDSINCLRSISSARRHDEYTRSPTKMKLVLALGKSRGYWTYHTPENGSSQLKGPERLTTKRPQCYLTRRWRSRSWTLPLLVR